MTVTPADARLDGKVAVVTGAAQGIGEATALALAGVIDYEGLSRAARALRLESDTLPVAALVAGRDVVEAQLADALQVGAFPAPRRDHPAVFVGKQADRLGGPYVDAKNVHSRYITFE